MKKINLTAFDFETATYTRMPCQLGLVIVRAGQIVEEKLFLIKPPGNKYDQGCMNVHGITACDTKSCMNFDCLFPEIKEYLEHEFIVAHNLAFDADVLDRVTEYYGLPKVRVLGASCTQRIYCNKSLKDATIALEIPMEEHHNALSDARACAQIFIEYLMGVNPDSLPYPTRKNQKQEFYSRSFDEKRKISHEAKMQELSIVENKDTIFYDKKVVISGIFDRFPIREDLALLLKNMVQILIHPFFEKQII